MINNKRNNYFSIFSIFIIRTPVASSLEQDKCERRWSNKNQQVAKIFYKRYIM